MRTTPPNNPDLQLSVPHLLFVAEAELKAAGEKLCSLGHRPRGRLLETEVGVGSDPPRSHFPNRSPSAWPALTD